MQCSSFLALLPNSDAVLEAIAIDEENMGILAPTKLPRRSGDRWRVRYPVSPEHGLPLNLRPPGRDTPPATGGGGGGGGGGDLVAASPTPNRLPKTAGPQHQNWSVLITVSGSFIRVFKNWLLFYNRLDLPVPLEVIAQVGLFLFIIV